MKPIAPVFGLPLGISSTFWYIIGLIRFITEELSKKSTKANRFKAREIAAIIPAHNEELVIEKCIRFLKLSLKKRQIYVVSDGSSDKPYLTARREGVHASKLYPGRGKAKALVYAISRYKLFEKYKFIFIIDADTQIDKNFVSRALPYFDDPEISVVFGSAMINWPNHIVPRLKYYYVAYRERLNRMLQYFFIYGQTWKYTNVNYVIPGFATIYRTRILKKLPIDTPGLLIEDFNTAFQLHKKGLGKIGYNPQCIGWDQHPETLADYWRQVKRWNVGFFQTLRINGFWPSFFWLSLAVFTIEVFVHSIFILLLPFVILFLLTPYISNFFPQLMPYYQLYQGLGPYKYLNLSSLFIYFFVVDYGLTIVIGLTYKKPQFIIYGLFFFFMHYITSLILMSSLVPGFFSRGNGQWISPKRSREQIKDSL